MTVPLTARAIPYCGNATPYRLPTKRQLHPTPPSLLLYFLHPRGGVGESGKRLPRSSYIAASAAPLAAVARASTAGPRPRPRRPAALAALVGRSPQSRNRRAWLTRTV